jgi:heme-degrading monooxygenase HmoA
MIIRLVKMTFLPEHVGTFTQLFHERKSTIARFEGCQHLELWHDTTDENVFFTYSVWDSEDHLNHYRFSEFFRETWALTKSLFSAKAVAWSVRQSG